MVKKADLARKYREIYGIDMPTRKLASIMLSENDVFTSLEDARDSLRYIENKKGNGFKLKTNFIMKENRPSNPYKLPQFEDRKREPYILPKANNNILVLADLHIPYTHTPSVEKAIKYGLDNKVNTIILLGDVLDNHWVSNYDKDASRRNQEEEMAICKEFLRRIRSLFPNAQIYWMKGNHCIRWEVYIKRNAKDLATMNCFQLEEVLKLNEEKIIMIDDKTIVKAGNLTLHHGHYLFGRFGSTNPAKTLWDKTNTDFMCGHLHQNVKYEKVTTKGIGRTYILGCLSEIGLNVDYNPITNQYRRGFAHVIVNKDGSYKAELIDGIE